MWTWEIDVTYLQVPQPVPTLDFGFVEEVLLDILIFTMYVVFGPLTDVHFKSFDQDASPFLDLSSLNTKFSCLTRFQGEEACISGMNVLRC